MFLGSNAQPSPLLLTRFKSPHYRDYILFPKLTMELLKPFRFDRSDSIDCDREADFNERLLNE